MDRVDCRVLTDKFVEICREFKVDGCGVETNQFQELLADDIQDKAAELGFPLQVAQLDNKTKKEVRIRRLTPYLAQKRIKFLRKSPGSQLCVQQMKDFPVGDHDDGPDALEMAIRVAQGVYNGRMLQQPEGVEIEQ
jgi:predicted phage terminase large subunit-like protein